MRASHLAIMLILTASVFAAKSYSQGSRLSGNNVDHTARKVHPTVSQAGAASSAIAQMPQRCSRSFIPLGVRHRVPQDYATIQAAIDASSDGDTVLVSEGTYLENIRYRGKAIIVASLYLIDGDTSHISRTIVDGSGSTIADSGSVVYFISGEDTTSVLCGLTIQGGSGTRFYYHYYFGTYWAMVGGGIFCNNASAKISDNIIKRNRIVAPVPQGGGVEAFGSVSLYPYIILEGNWITENSVYGSSTTSGQWAGSAGVDLTGVQARVISNTIEKDTVIGIPGAYGGGMSLVPSIPGKWPSAVITGNIFRSNYVAAQSEAADGAGLELELTGDVMINGSTFERNSAVCANGGYESEGGGVRITDQDVVGCGLKVLSHNVFLCNTVSCDGLNCGAGLLFFKTKCIVSRCMFKGNAVLGEGAGPNGLIGGGGAIKGASSSFAIDNCIVVDNYSKLDGGGLLFVEGNLPGFGTERTLVNCTVVGNQAGGHGGGMAVSQTSAFVSLNGIFWADTAAAGDMEIEVSDSVAGICHCDVQGGHLGTGNINVDPRFADTSYHLSDSSLCIGAGLDSIEIVSTLYRAPNTCFFGTPRPNPAGSKPDMGACENPLANPLTGISEWQDIPPSTFALAQNYPNPFNPVTNIRYQISDIRYLTLKVYDLLGREVAMLVNEVKQPGKYTVTWDASGVSSGVYFYRLQAGNFVDVKKLVVLR